MKPFFNIRKSIIPFALLLIILSSCRNSGRTKVEFRAKLIKPPVATLQLGPAIFVPESVIDRLQITEGFPVRVEVNGKSQELRIYRIIKSKTGFSVHKKYRDFWQMELGKEYAVKLQKIDPAKATIKPKPVRFLVENYHGNTQQWQRMAIGAPHGDCDMETGTIVHILQQNFGIPATAAYGARLSYRGIWYDANRPLMKLPKKGGGVIPERVWNQKAEKVYHTYQDSVWQNSGLHYGRRFRFFCSFHGHDLTVRLKDGKVIQRPVIEAMGIGFSKEDLRQIKKFYDAHKNEYYPNPPMMVFGNLPEDRIYRYQGIPLHFFYSGLGTRVYGSLRSDLLEYGMHIETPNSMRLDPKVQPQTARFLHDLYDFILNNILAEKKKVAWQKNIIPFNKPVKQELVSIKGGTFLMGAPKDVGWSGEHPQHRVRLKSYKIDKYEVTNAQYARFLNRSLKDGLIRWENGVVKDAAHPERIWCKTRKAAPMSDLLVKNNRFQVAAGRESFPVVFVSWYGAEAYAKAYGERLPTEAEWEMAAGWDARHHRKYIYAYASDWVETAKANSEDSGDPYEKLQGLQTTPVNYYEFPSPNGVYGMGGNVMEWCDDYYDYGLYKKAPEGVWDNPHFSEKKTMRTVRGGAWNLEPWVGRTTFRLGINPNATLVNVGFRCAK